MSPPKRLSFSLNPLWSHYIALIATVLAVVVGLVRFIFLERLDPLRCDALMNRGSWLDKAHQNWQPDGCMLHTYKVDDASGCLTSRQLIFIGDSITRKLFFQLAHILDPSLPTAPTDDEQKHADHAFSTKDATKLMFYWDPFLNSSGTREIITTVNNVSLLENGNAVHRPALLVLGSGLWYLRYADSSGGLPAWEANVKYIVGALARGRSRPADRVVLLPVEEIVPSKLSHERALSMRASDIDAMNSDLFHRVNPSSGNYFQLFSNPPPSMPVSLPLVFNQLLDPSQTDDGLHFSDAIVKAQANILLNFRCNDMLPKRFPLDKTCCRGYPWPSILQSIILGLVVLWGPYTWFISRQSGQRPTVAALVREGKISPLIFSAATALIFVADRTGFWLKEQKQFNPWTFTFLSLTFLFIGLVTVKRGDKDLGFLNREQTDEWKGWMQIAILIYHYLGASKISGIYNPIRVLVASYLFMTGYGHTTFYLRKADFGFLRIAQVMVRLNIFTLLLAYTMNTDYISYYFAPLVSMWFLIIYVTMVAGAQFNDRTPFLVCKILLSAGIITWFMNEAWPLEALFGFLERVCGIHWSAREWGFRVNLDLWIVYIGMFTALAVIKIREFRLTDHPLWPLAVKLAIGTSGVVLFWFIAFELFQQSKFTYNGWHPYISFLPVLAFAVLRNANPILRSASSRAFAFVGTCSLETFIIQYHFWLAGDTKGVLLVIPGTRWRPVNFVITTTMFIYTSHRVAQATVEITTSICGGASKSLPLPTTVAADASSSFYSNRRREGLPSDNNQEVMVPLKSPGVDHVNKDRDGSLLPPEPDTSVRPPRWVDRLAEGPSPQSKSHSWKLWYETMEWKSGVKMRLAIGFGLMWITNIAWSYPTAQ